MLTPASAYNLQPSGMGTEPSNRRCPILSHCLGLRGLGPPFRWCEAPRKGYPLRVLTVQVTSGTNLLWRTCPHWVTLSDVRVIMMIMCVLVVELLCQAMMGWVPTLECLLPGAFGCMWLRIVLSSIK
jgi:hypothetical protein